MQSSLYSKIAALYSKIAALLVAMSYSVNGAEVSPLSVRVDYGAPVSILLRVDQSTLGAGRWELFLGSNVIGKGSEPTNCIILTSAIFPGEHKVCLVIKGSNNIVLGTTVSTSTIAISSRAPISGMGYVLLTSFLTILAGTIGFVLQQVHENRKGHRHLQRRLREPLRELATRIHGRIVDWEFPAWVRGIDEQGPLYSRRKPNLLAARDLLIEVNSWKEAGRQLDSRMLDRCYKVFEEWRIVVDKG
jgi:hypothetical protein